jgi:hypothetical protein
VGQLVEAMWWHPVYDDDPEHAYLRDVVMRATELAIGLSAAPAVEPAGMPARP